MKRPEKLILTDDFKFPIPVPVWEAINEYLADTYGKVPDGYGLNIMLDQIQWGDDNE